MLTELLNRLEAEWRRVQEYTDVQAIAWTPSQPIETQCPQGCVLELWEPATWGLVEGHDARRQTKFCRAHGYARIYVITGPDAAACGWDPSKE